MLKVIDERDAPTASSSKRRKTAKPSGTKPAGRTTSKASGKPALRKKDLSTLSTIPLDVLYEVCGPSRSLRCFHELKVPNADLGSTGLKNLVQLELEETMRCGFYKDDLVQVDSGFRELIHTYVWTQSERGRWPT